MDLLTNTKEPPKIRVVVRKRPLNSKESKKNDQDVLEIQDAQSLIVKELKTKVDLTKFIEEHHFTFDNVFELDAQNQDIYQECVLPLVVEAFKGAKTTCFAYGQTGSGKTFTMMGTSDGQVPGLYLLAAFDVIELLQQYEDLEIYLSFYEIYCGKLYDLLNNKQELTCREDAKHNVNIIGITEKPITQVEEIMAQISKGLLCRTSGQTGANAESSRSHAILQMQIRHYGKSYGKMSFIDLAGSERGADTMNTNKQTKMDGAEINKSLLALKECIRALDLEKKHLPFRGSKLTQVLKDSFTGNSKTTMIANVSPANSCCEHTLNTLRYADRVKDLKKSNEPQVQGGAQPLPQKQTKQDIMNKELMLARQSTNTKKVALNQNTMKPKELEKPPADFGKPQLKGAAGGATTLVQPQMRQEQQQLQNQTSSSFNNFMNALSGASQNNNLKPQNRPQSMMLDQNQSTNASFNQKPQQNQMMPNPRQSQNINSSFQQQQQQQAQNQPAPKFGFNRQNSLQNQAVTTPLQVKGPQLKQQQPQQQQQQLNQQNQLPNFHPQQQQQQFGNQQTFPNGQIQQNNSLQIQKPSFQNQKTANPYQQKGAINNFAGQQSPSQNQIYNQQQQPQSNPASQRKFSVNNNPGGFSFNQQQNSTPQQKQQPVQQQQQQVQQPMSLQQRRLTQQQKNKMMDQPQQQQQQEIPKKKPMQSYEYYALGDAIPTYEELETQYNDDSEKLCNDHEQLIEQILEEEEELINGHRKHIDDLVDLVKGEMALLNDVDKPGSDVENYVNNLDKLFLQKIDMMHKIRQTLIDFHTHLKTEESMSKLYQQHQNLNGMGDQMEDVQGQNDEEDMLLNGDDINNYDINHIDHLDQIDGQYDDQMNDNGMGIDGGQMQYMDDDQDYNYGDDGDAY